MSPLTSPTQESPHADIESAADAYAAAVAVERRMAWSGVSRADRAEFAHRRRRAWDRFWSVIVAMSGTDGESFGMQVIVSLHERLKDEESDATEAEMRRMQGGEAV